MTTKHTMQILHLSDLHTLESEIEGEEGNFDQSIVLCPLLARVKTDYDKGMKPELVIITGDIAYHGKKGEYLLARPFLDTLLKTLELGNDRLFIVPGNHDVNRKKYRPTDIPKYPDMKTLNTELTNHDYRQDLLRGMAEYFSFIEEHYPHLRPQHDRLIPFLQVHTAQCGKRIGLVGLNSAWMCREKDDKGKIAIGEYQINCAMKELEKEGQIDLYLNCFHHPLTWLWPVDQTIVRRNFPHNSITLCGHQHDAKGEFFNDHDGGYCQFQAGAAYLGSNSEWPARYQYLTLDWDVDTIRLDFRKFRSKDDRIWNLDSDTGNDGIKIYENIGILKSKGVQPSLPAVALLEIPSNYKTWIKIQYTCMDVDRLQAKGQAIRVSLPDVFIPLYGYAPKLNRKKDQADTSTVKTEAHLLGEREKPVDIEKLIATHPYLLIQGQAGCGKSTLLRHLAYQMVESQGVSGMEGCLPVLILLKDLAKAFSAKEGSRDGHLVLEDLLRSHFGNGDLIDLELVNKFIKNGKVVFLLDGLDEIIPAARKIVVEIFARLRAINPGNRIVFSGRPHGITGDALEKFGEGLIEVLPLEKEQVDLFINKWFQGVAGNESFLTKTSAVGMIADIEAHEAIKELTETPLMLTAICILYYDGRELPSQRAELYHKFVDNMLYRRFAGEQPALEPEKVKEFLMKLAFHMHTQEVRGIDKGVAVSIMAEILQKIDNEKANEHRKRAATLFNEIELKCGLLKLERDGQYGFWHHTFQEFLTALHIQDNAIDFSESIEIYLDNPWYREVVKLYIGSLSMDNKGMANRIIGSCVKDGSPTERCLLAAGAMVDIHRDRRDETTVIQTRNCLLEIITKNKGLVPALLAEAGEALGWLGDKRALHQFIAIQGGSYNTAGGNFVITTGVVPIAPFAIGKYLVTNSWYREFVEAGGYRQPGLWSAEGRKWLNNQAELQPRFWKVRRWICPNAPVVGVSWYEADAFTRWLSETNNEWAYRLPTELEWEAVAAGFNMKREYPWGKDWRDNNCNSKEAGLKRTSPVGIFAGGNTPEGVADLAGNVWEWTTSDYHLEQIRTDFRYDKEIENLWKKAEKTQDYDELLTILRDKNQIFPVRRGGSWLIDRAAARCACRSWYNPLGRYVNIGFRCARTIKIA